MLVFICDVCSKEFTSKQSLGGYKSAGHNDKPRYSLKRKISKNETYHCQFCNRETTNAGANKSHENRCKLNDNKVDYPSQNRPGRKLGCKGENQYTKAERLGLPKPKVSYETKHKISVKSKQQRHTEETKRKISESRKKFIQENPHMSPWVYSHYTKRKSYAERYWKKIFTIYRVKFEEQYPVSRYCLDFAVLDTKIDIEIDGEQHYYDQRIVESDKKRNAYLENLGWKVIRIRWSEYKTLVDKQDRKNYVNDIMKQI